MEGSKTFRLREKKKGQRPAEIEATKDFELRSVAADEAFLARQTRYLALAARANRSQEIRTFLRTIQKPTFGRVYNSAIGTYQDDGLINPADRIYILRDLDNNPVTREVYNASLKEQDPASLDWLIELADKNVESDTGLQKAIKRATRAYNLTRSIPARSILDAAAIGQTRALAKPRFGRVYNSAIGTYQDDGLINPADTTYILRDRENNPVTREVYDASYKVEDTTFIDVLVSDLDIAAKTVTEKKALEKRLDTRTRYFDLTKRKNPQTGVLVKTLLSPTRGRVYNSSAGNYVNDGIRNPADPTYILKDLDNNPVTSDVYAERYEIQDQKELEAFKGLAGLLYDAPEYMRLNMSRYFETGDVGELERCRQTMVANGDEETYATKVDEVVKYFDKVKRVDGLKKRFFDLYGQDGTADQLRLLLTEFAPQEAEEQALVAEFADRVRAKRRLKFGQDFYNELSKMGGSTGVETYDKLLDMLREFAASPDGNDQVFAQRLAVGVYEVEVAAFRKRVAGTFKAGVQEVEVRRVIEELPLRPSLDDIDYVAVVLEAKELANTFFVAQMRNERLQTSVALRKRYEAFAQGRQIGAGSAEAVLADIQAFPDDTEEAVLLKQKLFVDFRNKVAAADTAAFDRIFAGGLAVQIQERLQERFAAPELGRNKEALDFLRRRYVRSMYPLVETLRDDPRTKDAMGDILDVRDKSGKSVRSLYQLRLKELEKQRPLTDIERAYLDSVELVSLFNPYLVAAASAEPGVTQEFLNHHFDTRSRRTLETLKDGDHIPLLCLGLGPQGVISLGEVARLNPALASQTLVIDEGEQPGGPFAIPRGPAWELNSANRRGKSGPSLPDAPGPRELQTVRAYGNPATRWFPGERKTDSDVRFGSINTTVDYLLTPDDLSTARYPTNEELQLTIALQASVLTDRVALKTRIEDIEPIVEMQNERGEGPSYVTLLTEQPDGTERRVRIIVDGIIGSTGLGEKSYGFKYEGSRAQRVAEATKGLAGFPKISTTLEAFRGLSDRSAPKESPGETIIISGSGNSVDTLIENIGSLFAGENPKVRNVQKIIIVADRDLSRRPRYALIQDLRPRNGKGNLIEFVRGRVGDVDFAPMPEGEELDPMERTLQVYGQDGQLLRDAQGKPLEGNAFIAGAGFKQNLDAVFGGYLKDGESFRADGEQSPLQPLTLPTAPEIAVAEELKANPNILIVGTASKPRFTSPEKLAQLPREAREALQRNGAENAVAIGFRGPDTQAAVNIWLNSRDITVEAAEEAPRTMIDVDGKFTPNARVDISELPETAERLPYDNIANETTLLSSLLAYAVGNNFEARLNGDDAARFTGNVRFRLEYFAQAGKFNLAFEGSDSLPGVSEPLIRAVSSAVNDPYFQRYAIAALKKRRRNPALELTLVFKRGFVDPKNTYVDTI